MALVIVGLIVSIGLLAVLSEKTVDRRWKELDEHYTRLQEEKNESA
jgi:uncharacterized protein (DUF2235 family)